jgi:metal-responsive CopG/Arc/MetJ family transcriptional regulator
MQVKTKTLMKIQVTLNDKDASRLSEMSQQTGKPASDLIAKAIRDFLAGVATEKEESDSWSAMSLSAFEKEWDNDKDAAYDNWRELYEVKSR